MKLLTFLPEPYGRLKTLRGESSCKLLIDTVLQRIRPVRSSLFAIQTVTEFLAVG